MCLNGVRLQILKPKGSLEIVIKNSDKIEKLGYTDKMGLEGQ